MELRELQLKELAMLKDYAKLCDENDLRYYLAGGTLLGAVRHRGFIPWDDDIDVIMPRPDFESFLEIFKANPMEGYRVDDSQPFAKLEKPEELVRLKIWKNPKPLWIDIFPMDGLPENEGECKSIFKRVNRLNYALWQAQSNEQSIKNPLKRLAKTIIFYRYRKKGELYYSKKITEIVKEHPFDNSEYVGCVTGRYGESEKIKKSVFLPREKMVFEDDSFFVSKGYDTYLTNLFGEYMKMPDNKKEHVDFG